MLLSEIRGVQKMYSDAIRANDPFIANNMKMRLEAEGFEVPSLIVESPLSPPPLGAVEAVEAEPEIPAIASSTAPAPSAAGAQRQRKERADKGMKRGPRKKNTGEGLSASSAGTDHPPSPSTTPARCDSDQLPRVDAEPAGEVPAAPFPSVVVESIPAVRFIPEPESLGEGDIGLAPDNTSGFAKLACDLNRVLISAEVLDRKSGIGASRIFDVITDPMKVYCELRGITEPMEDNELLEAGRFFESAIASWFGHRTGLTVVGDGRIVVRHPAIPWAYASPDRFLYDPSSERMVALLECKNVGGHRREMWGAQDDQDVPERYWMQTQWQMGVTGVNRCYLAAVIGGNRPRFDNVIEFDPAFFATLVEIAGAFWVQTQSGTPPEVTGSDSSREWVRATFQQSRGDIISGADDARELATQYIAARVRERALNEVKAEAQNKLCAMIADHDGIEGDGYVATWKADKRGIRVFRCSSRGE